MDKLTYTTALQELENIVRGLEQGPHDIDTLSERLARARQLLDFCNKRLYQVKSEIDKTLDHEQE